MLRAAWCASPITCSGEPKVRQDIFEARYAARWQELEATLAPVKRTTEAAAAAAADSSTIAPLPPHVLPRRYRQVCHHLALARDRHYGTAVVSRLERLVLMGHQQLYGARGLGASIMHFLQRGLPILVRQYQAYVWVSALLFFGPLLACLVAIQYFPDFAYVIMSPAQLGDVQQMYSPHTQRIGVRGGAESDFMMFAFYIGNNVKIDFQVFASGLLLGVGSIFFLVFNGLHIGVVAGHLTQVGYIETFWGFVAGHSAFELTGIVLSGASGLMVGMCLIAPGQRTRFDALKAKMPDIIGLVYGAALLTFFAAFIEGFWSASRLPPVEIKYAVGVILWIVTIAYFVIPGRKEYRAA